MRGAWVQGVKQGKYSYRSTFYRKKDHALSAASRPCSGLPSTSCKKFRTLSARARRFQVRNSAQTPTCVKKQQPRAQQNIHQTQLHFSRPETCHSVCTAPEQAILSKLRVFCVNLRSVLCFAKYFPAAFPACSRIPRDESETTDIADRRKASAVLTSTSTASFAQ